MAPPATKRRKLEHSDSEAESEGSFADFDETNAVELDGSDAQDEDESDVEMNGQEEDVEDDEDEDMSDEGEEEFEEEEDVHESRKQTAAGKATSVSKPHKKPAPSLQDGVYTAESFKSNMFKFQVDELLDQVKLKYSKKEAPAENAMRTLKTIIEQIPSREALLIPEAEKSLKSAGVAIPFPSPRPSKDTLYKLQYERPASINATGSYPLKTATRNDDGIAIDLVVTMPKSLFTEKDYLNHRYFYKRSYYLASLAAGIKASNDHKFELSFESLNGNQLQPILVVRPSGNGDADDFSSSKCQINILVSLPENTFAPHKLLPNSNCVRPKGNDDEVSSKALTPTPFYNNTMQSDANVTAYLKLLHGTASRAEAFKDACILGRIWLKQRGFGGEMRKGGFGNFEFAAIMALLLQPNAGTGAQSVSSGFSSYQLFKSTLQFLSRGDLTKKPFIFQAQNITVPKTETAPVVFDGPRGQNILFKMTPWSYSRLRSEAKATVDMLSDSVLDNFDAAFILKTELLKYRYDATLEIPLASLGISNAGEDYSQRLSETCQKIHSTLTRALTNRITTLSFTMPEEESWSISSRRPVEKQSKSILVNFATEPANATRTVDHGPSAENKQEAASFRKFWGEKAELRRFKDGSILESVVWSVKDAASVMEQIVVYTLGKHVGVQVAEQSKFTSDAFGHLITAGRMQGQSGTAPFLPIMNAFSAMEKDIRDLEELPLRLRHLRAADPQLRYSSVEVPSAGHVPASVVLQFEGSGRWPDDLCAIQRTKIAFLLRLAELLDNLGRGYTARVGMENPSQPAQNQAFLDVTVSTGYTFRIRIYHDREPTLFERQIKDKSLDAPSRESAASSLALYKREFIQSPLHSQVLQTLCTRFLALSPAIRLMKKWFASHLLAPHFSSELIELLVIRTFLQPHPWPVPSTATTGFLRTLSWISRWDWRHAPLIVDFSTTFSANPADLEDTTSKGMKSEDLDRLQTRFEAWRRIDPAMNRVVLFAATNLDEEGTTWTDKAKPEKVVAARLTALAKAATQAVRAEEDRLLRHINSNKDTAQAQNALSPESLFMTSISDFDIVITISSKYSLKSSKSRKSAPQFKNLDLQRSATSNPSAQTPLTQLFAQDLLEVYGDAVLWFWDPETLDKIVGLWNPVVTAQRSWKVKAGWNSVPVGKKDAVEIKANKDAIVHEFRRLGGELVKSIDVKS
ncbi:pre-rRNA processing protein Utp22 [Pyrenophora tritici-repentis]|uniref:U3 small nucleolar RNA-associated protein 22 n=1 Tax=Pyrenophora tritici-repentis TaxID=45151 RepID=A0A2W1GEE8_9PLEO|nr:pre-rRNA processing protein Utp22 [Pyrenophora tritici-repentis]KAI0573506.1 Pre-rRNA processing protein Utp22 [Pyrenophora tritici-repentis]KAI0577379.1 Pre-rRNA processing protein Utp22 [Pyrenophora tritici-repentis]KAI0606315.1 Pre-rRNA processing protein Utp22 [Pyrenophora tritici-repentis]KAI0619506.1 Pre-rRNA processing protein Utp22 [Pyrenophora tritici-repentis]